MPQTSGSSASTEKPFFRYDLETTAVEVSGQQFVDVKCPDSGSSFRFFAVEYAIACGMDGEHSLAELVDWAKEELDLKTTTDEIGAVLSKLSELNFVEQPAGAPVAAAPLAPAPVAAAPVAAAPVAAAPVAAAPVAAAPVAAAPVAAAPVAASQDEVELGLSGRSPMQRERPPAPAIADDVELGLAGAGPIASSRPEAAANAGIELGAAGYEEKDDFPEPSREVSTDLSQTFRIDKGDVQAAVRASKIMQAVELPADLQDELDERAVAEAAADLSPAQHDADDLEFQIGEEAKTSTGREAIVLPEEPAQIAKREAVEALVDEAVEKAEKAKKAEGKKKSGRRSSASMALWLILLAAVGAGAAYYYMEYVREKPGEVGPSDAAKRAAQVQASNEVRVEPVAPASTLVIGETPISEAAVDKAGIVGAVIAPGTEVAEGDAIVKLKGYERYDRDIAKHETSLTGYQARLETAQTRNETAKIADLEKNVARKQADIEATVVKRDAFFVKAQIGGVAEVLVEAGARVTPGQVVAKVSGQATATAEFELPAGVSAAIDDEMTIVDAGDAELKATCKVTAVEGQKVSLLCPSDSGISAAAAIKLEL